MFDPDEFLKLAENLIKESPTEAEIRSSISRAYYGSFHLCKKWLESEKGHGFQNRVGDQWVNPKIFEKRKRSPCNG